LNCARFVKCGNEACVKVYEFRSNGTVRSAVLCKNCLTEFKEEIPKNEKSGFATYRIVYFKVKVILI
jgi:protein-arginine kinase activator protein McsA